MTPTGEDTGTQVTVVDGSIYHIGKLTKVQKSESKYAPNLKRQAYVHLGVSMLGQSILRS